MLALVKKVKNTYIASASDHQSQRMKYDPCDKFRFLEGALQCTSDDASRIAAVFKDINKDKFFIKKINKKQITHDPYGSRQNSQRYTFSTRVNSSG